MKKLLVAVFLQVATLATLASAQPAGTGGCAFDVACNQENLGTKDCFEGWAGPGPGPEPDSTYYVIGKTCEEEGFGFWWTIGPSYGGESWANAWNECHENWCEGDCPLEAPPD